MTMEIAVTSEYKDEKNAFTQTGYFCFVLQKQVTALLDS